MTEGIIIGIISIGAIILIVILTKSIWQWVIGTSVLIKEVKKQTILLSKIHKNLMDKKNNS